MKPYTHVETYWRNELRWSKRYKKGAAKNALRRYAKRLIHKAWRREARREIDETLRSE